MSSWIDITHFGAPFPLLIEAETGRKAELWAWWEWIG